jgi:hypothetical protein
MSRIGAALLGCVLVVASAAPSSAELAAWDQAKVTALAKQLEGETKALYDTFYKQPVPSIGSGQSQEYRRLKQEVRRLRSEAGELSRALAAGEGRDDTLPVYENLMQKVREARELAGRIFTTKDVQDRASAVRKTLNEISPFYDPDAVPLQPVTR